jgi:hypothetical protein
MRPVSGTIDIGAFEFASAAPIEIVTTTLPNPIRGRHYNRPIAASGGSGSYVWSVTSGSLPAGLILETATGVIRGRPRFKGNSSFTITVQDAQTPANSVSQAYSLQTALYPMP